MRIVRKMRADILILKNYKINQDEVETRDEEIDEVVNEEQTQYNVSTQTDGYLDDFNNLTYPFQEEDKSKEVKQNNALILKNIIQHKPKRQKDLDDYSVKSDDFFSDRSKKINVS